MYLQINNLLMLMIHNHFLIRDILYCKSNRFLLVLHSVSNFKDKYNS